MPSQTNPCLLLAEDDQMIRAVLGSMLQRRGYELQFAEDGYQVVEMLELRDYDIILLDVKMPRMSGIEASQIIREREKIGGGYTPIVGITAHTTNDERERCIAAGMDICISKPVDFRKLLEVIEEILEKKRMPKP